MELRENHFIAVYMELTGCSESAARNVYILHKESNREISDETETEVLRGIQPFDPDSTDPGKLKQAA